MFRVAKEFIAFSNHSISSIHCSLQKKEVSNLSLIFFFAEMVKFFKNEERKRLFL